MKQCLRHSENALVGGPIRGESQGKLGQRMQFLTIFDYLFRINLFTVEYRTDPGEVARDFSCEFGGDFLWFS